LFVQGPPGTGKTYTGARVIAKLIAAGKTVGVMANSHKAIHNLMHEIEAVAGDTGLGLTGLHKHSKQNVDSPYVSCRAQALIASADDNRAAEAGDYNLISGNAWLFAREGMVDRVDYLFIDEAGQTSLADALAVSPSAKNIVLLGDPMQLAQVSQGAHAEGAAASVLGHLLGDASTVPRDRGVLLDMSYRMHPAICDFISSAIYDGRLKADRLTANNRVSSPGLSGSGLRYLPVEHVGSGRSSFEEAERIVREVELLLRGAVTRKAEPERRLSERDILVVTPYNAQRKKIAGMLAAAGHGEVPVGTVDKFQGQEAPVVFYSMATSSGEDVPRNLEFLFEKNRFNVAVSRAQCLSVLVCSPRLLDVRCSHPAQMALVNLLCRYVEQAVEAPAVPYESRLAI
ncbi:MAG: DEAD/DEAH box helicase, partial [Vulcanimicrobiaceae bacterium]